MYAGTTVINNLFLTLYVLWNAIKNRLIRPLDNWASHFIGPNSYFEAE